MCVCFCFHCLPLLIWDKRAYIITHQNWVTKGKVNSQNKKYINTFKKKLENVTYLSDFVLLTSSIELIMNGIMVRQVLGRVWDLGWV